MQGRSSKVILSLRPGLYETLPPKQTHKQRVPKDSELQLSGRAHALHGEALGSIPHSQETTVAPTKYL